jgi:tRNA pseudouridine38-40 synthase
MYRYQLIIEYDGNSYIGWQKQKKGKSIQGTLERILSKILKEKITIYGSGRTDAGVHAYEQSSHFEIFMQDFLLQKESILTKY